MTFFDKFRKSHPEQSPRPLTPEQAEAVKPYIPLGGAAGALLVAREVTQEECPWLPRTLEPNEVLFRFTQQTYGACSSENGMPVSFVKDEYPFFQVPRDALIGEL